MVCLRLNDDLVAILNVIFVVSKVADVGVGWSCLGPVIETDCCRRCLRTEEGFDEYKDHYLSGMGVPHAVYVDVTSIVCRHACVKLHSDSCCSVVYERANRRCLVTPLDHNSTDTRLVQRPHTVYYKRRRCSGPTSYSFSSQSVHEKM